MVALSATLPFMATAFARYRQETGKTLDATAETFDVDKKTILRWESGHTLIPIKRLDTVCAITGIARQELRPDLAQMFGGEAA
jgi:DNA-binding XRE family transcriptional regulator